MSDRYNVGAAALFTPGPLTPKELASMPAKGTKRPDRERFLAFVPIREAGCWLFMGTTSGAGYGMFWNGGYDANGHPQQVGAHRFAYELFVGPIPSGWHIDHRCHDSSLCHKGKACPHRRCVNPAHLAAVTRAENDARTRGKPPSIPNGGAMAARQRAKTHCPQGHPYDSANTIQGKTRPHRDCRRCHADRQARRRRLTVA